MPPLPTSVVTAPLVSTLRLGAYFGLTVALLPVQIAAHLLRLPLRMSLPHWYHRCCVRVLGMRLEVRGEPVTAAPVLYVCNHCSYLDIMIYGALLPASFISKAEVAGWPLFGLLAKLQRSVFIDRKATAARDHLEAVRGRLAAGDSLILFPEGTSSDGNRVLPFRSSLFSAAEVSHGDRPLTVQPISLAYTHLDGMPLGRHLRPFFSWYGHMNMAGHLARLAGLGCLTTTITFHAPVTFDRFTDRKEMSAYCWRVVARGVGQALAGRPDASSHSDRPPAASEPA